VSITDCVIDILSAVVVRWYDRRGLNRLDPKLLGYVAASVQQYKSRNADTRHDPSEADAKASKWGAPAPTGGCRSATNFSARCCSLTFSATDEPRTNDQKASFPVWETGL
jgi:hypothetical protein